MKDIALLTANYNIDALTFGMVKSLRGVLEGLYMPSIYVIDNSDETPIREDYCKELGINIIDNRDRVTSLTKDPSTNHCRSIEYGIQNIDSEYIMLVDNDVFFKNSFRQLFEDIIEKESFDCIGKIGHDLLPADRLFPYLCFFNRGKMMKDSIHYYREGSIVKGYSDTGWSFLCDIKNKGWIIEEIEIFDYIIHLKNGSFGRKNITEWLKKC